MIASSRMFGSRIVAPRRRLIPECKCPGTRGRRVHPTHTLCESSGFTPRVQPSPQRPGITRLRSAVNSRFAARGPAVNWLATSAREGGRSRDGRPQAGPETTPARWMNSGSTGGRRTTSMPSAACSPRRAGTAGAPGSPIRPPKGCSGRSGLTTRRCRSPGAGHERRPAARGVRRRRGPGARRAGAGVGAAYEVYVVGGQWQAWRQNAGDEDVLTGSTPDELNAAIRADWAREGTS